MKTDFLSSGTLSVGANYWASHAGTNMWREWNEEVVAKDFMLLSRGGLQVLRVFPLWPDFQPIHTLRSEMGRVVEYRHGEEPLPADGQDGVSSEMLKRFGLMADLAEKNNLGLIVGLVTGWMSGRLYVPPALDTRNPITDPVSIMWQVRLVKRIVREFKGHPAIKAWDLGNECNVMGRATREESWTWTSAIANAIHAVDPTRPVVSGMHSLLADPTAAWSIRDQGELTDILTTHPYPVFTPHCHREPVNTMRPLLHSTAETCLYADLSGRPAILEEFGTLSAMICGEEMAAAVASVRIFDIWAHDGRAALWWCAHDQLELEHAPYDWCPVERELGLVRNDSSFKPVFHAVKKVREAVEKMPFATLPPRRREAVCLLSSGQDNWGVAYSSFILARQAGFDLKFHYTDLPLPDADLYLLPSVSGFVPLSRRRENELWARVKAGATLYMSLDNTFLGGFSETTGLDVISRAERAGDCTFSWTDATGAKGYQGTYTLPAALRLSLRANRAEVLAAEANGNPIFSVASLGQGKVFYLGVPLEAALALQNEAFLPGTAQPFWQIYRTFADTAINTRAIRKNSPWVGITEHLTDDGLIAVFVNYLPEPVQDELTVSSQFRLTETCLGNAPVIKDHNHRLDIPANGIAVWKFAKA